MKIICIGRNYVEHIRELNSPMPASPVFFLKPETAVLRRNHPLYYPSFSSNIHYEIELVLRVSRAGKGLQPDEAMDYVNGIGIGLDFTARDLQDQAKSKGLPWTLSKGFDGAAPVSSFQSPVSFSDWKNIHFHLDLNGQTVQQGNSSMMIFPFAELLSYISQFITLRKGDIVFTGTPSGVGPIRPGDLLEGYLEGKRMLSCAIL
jgi:2-keto-4-pentenoate hydratase/2-oxohepta-3-ene-1,7-dioic acid hydratase in catechol pathway